MKRAFGRILAAWVVALCTAAPVAAQGIFPPGSSLDVPSGGSVNLFCVPLDMQGALNLNGGTVSVDTNASFAAGAIVTGSSGTISVGGDVSIGGALSLGGNTLVLRDGCVPGNTTQLTGTLTVLNLVLQSDTGRRFVLPAGTNVQVLGQLTLQGAPGQPIELVAASGTAVVQLGPTATVVRNDATVTASVQIGAGATTVAAIPTLSEVGLALLSLLMAAAVAWRLRVPGRHRT